MKNPLLNKRRLTLPLIALALCPLPALAAPPAAYPALPPAPAAAPPPAVPQPMPAIAPSAPAAKPAKAPRLQGRVTAVDTAKRTITVDPRGAAGPVTMTLAPDAKIYAAGTGTMASLKAGDYITAYGQATPDAPALSTDRIAVLPAPAMRKKAKRNAGFHPRRVEGTITAVTPTLSLLTPGGVTVAVTTTDATRVETLMPGTLATVAVGANINAQVSGDPVSPVASEVYVQPARSGKGGGGKGKRGKKGAGAETDTSIAPAAAPAL